MSDILTDPGTRMPADTTIRRAKVGALATPPLVEAIASKIGGWGWNAGPLLIAPVFFVMACATTISPGAPLDATTAPSPPVAGGLLAIVLLVELGGGAALAAGFERRTAAMALLSFMIIATIVIHGFWRYPAGEQQVQLLQFLKNVAIIGGLVLVAARRDYEDEVPAWLGFAGRLLVALIFFVNAFGILNQAVAARELAAAGMPRPLVPPFMLAARAAEAAGGLLLLLPNRLPVTGAVVLAGFLVSATLAAHDFWRAAPNLWWSELTNFFKNVAVIGALALVAAYYSREKRRALRP
jgi:putative oxidoreductase